MIRCLYCGYRTRANDRVCSLCSDLPRNDPYFTAAMSTTTKPKPSAAKARAAKPRVAKPTRYDLELADTIEAERLRRCR